MNERRRKKKELTKERMHASRSVHLYVHEFKCIGI